MSAVIDPAAGRKAFAIRPKERQAVSKKSQKDTLEIPHLPLAIILVTVGCSHTAPAVAHLIIMHARIINLGIEREHLRRKASDGTQHGI